MWECMRGIMSMGNFDMSGMSVGMGGKGLV